MKITKSKYNNVKTKADGYNFDSKKEYKRYCELKLLVKSNLIFDLRLQVAYELLPAQVGGFRKELKIVYKADFVYNKEGKEIIEDVKGIKTDLYVIKRKLMKSIGKEITEV